MMPGTVLLVDDSEDDLMLMKHATEVAGVDNPIVQLRGGQEAIEYLIGSSDYADRERYPIPCLLITDLKMPKIDGFDLLKWMSKRPEFDSIPRIVVSSSSHERDRKRAVDLGACAYFQKPLHLEDLVELVRHLDVTWIAKHCPKVPHGPNSNSSPL